jgi:hypothetical protein
VVKFCSIHGKQGAVFERHQYALIPWQKWGAEQAEPVRLLSLDYHTDKRRAFLRYAYRDAPLDPDPDQAASAEQKRLERLRALSPTDPSSVAAAVDDLWNDEHIDAALQSGILDLAFVISRDDQDKLLSNEQIEFYEIDKLTRLVNGRLRLGGSAAVDCCRLDGHTIFATVRGARDPVDRPPGADPFAGHRISPLAQPGNRCPRRVRKPSRRLGQIDDGCAVGSP